MTDKAPQTAWDAINVWRAPFPRRCESAVALFLARKLGGEYFAYGTFKTQDGYTLCGKGAGEKPRWYKIVREEGTGNRVLYGGRSKNTGVKPRDSLLGLIVRFLATNKELSGLDPWEIMLRMMWLPECRILAPQEANRPDRCSETVSQKWGKDPAKIVDEIAAMVAKSSAGESA